MAERARLTLDIDPALHKKLKMLAAQKRITMRELCLRAIEHEVQEEAAPYLTAEEAPLLAELWDNDEDAIYDDL
jgi:predicted transcriptional regulator